MGKFRNFFRNRLFVLIMISVVMAVILMAATIKLQIVQGEYYKQVASTRTYKTTTVKAPRGEITDRYGRVLAGNKSASSIIIDYNFDSKSELNDTIAALIKVVEECGETYEDTLPITLSLPYKFRTDEVSGLNLSEEQWKKSFGLSKKATASDAFDFFAKEYELTDIKDETLKRKIMGVRYDMQSRDFSGANPFTFYTDADISMVSKIKENAQTLQSVEVISEPIRTYGENKIAVHLLGQVGRIYREEYEELIDQNYGMNDNIGKDGLEKHLEKYLRGTDGREGRTVTLNGETVTLSEDLAVRPGNKAVLSIDASVQLAAEKTLSESVNALYNDGAVNVGGGAAVAIDVNTGEIIAMASNPTFDPETFSENYNALLNNPKKPMFNRAMAGAYPPGSTFKALTAIAGLEEGEITGKETIYCNGPYQAYAPSYTPACWIHNDYGGSHEYINVTKALEVSCNIFFYETGRRVGIETLNDYAKKFGLGEKTGIELSGEAEGVLAGPEYRKSIDKTWYPGDTIQAAIGQSDNMFTPLQMANYTATLANGGTRFKPHLIKSIVSYDGTKTVKEFEPEIADSIKISPENLKLVHAGMRAVCEVGSAKVVFGDYPIKVAGKTGTAQSGGNRTPHSWFISFAPYEDPQIAVAVIIEHAGINGLGKHVYNVAKSIYDAYFMSSQPQEMVKSNTILN